MTRITLCDGRYTIIKENGTITVLQYGEQWRYLEGYKLFVALVDEVERLRALVDTAPAATADLSEFIDGDCIASICANRAGVASKSESIDLCGTCDGRGCPVCHPVPEPAASPVPADMVLVPKQPTEAMWGGLARDIVWFLYSTSAPHRGVKFYKCLSNMGREVPEWLRKEIPDVDHSPSKGTWAACIYKAMIVDAAQPAAPTETGGNHE